MIDIGKTPVKSVSRNMAEATVRFVGNDSEEIGENHDNQPKTLFQKPKTPNYEKPLM